MFDIWLVLNRSLIKASEVIAVFEKYCKFNNQIITRALFEENMLQKYQHNDFTSDMKVLLTLDQHWDFKEAFDFVQKEVIDKLSEEAWKGLT